MRKHIQSALHVGETLLKNAEHAKGWIDTARLKQDTSILKMLSSDEKTGGQELYKALSDWSKQSLSQ
jgi:hypothetical protein